MLEQCFCTLLDQQLSQHNVQLFQRDDQTQWTSFEGLSSLMLKLGSIFTSAFDLMRMTSLSSKSFNDQGKQTLLMYF